MSLLSWFAKAPALVKTEKTRFLRVGGRVIDADKWSPEVLEQVRQQYFRPIAAKQFLSVIDLTTTCPMSHGSRERIALVGRSTKVVDTLIDALSKTRAELNCHECGKKSKLSAKSVVWQGQMENWDGAM